MVLLDPSCFGTTHGLITVVLANSSLKTLMVRGTLHTLAGYGGAQLIRFVRSLILTRLLFPEAFGVMSLVWAVMYGLAMVSDAGIGPAIIRDKRGEDPVFLDTAWTLQAFRGALLWVAACLLALPIARIYAVSDLAQIIPVAALTALIAGFGSTALHTCRRNMQLGRLALLEVANEILTLGVTALWAYLYPTVWALVGGALVGQLFMMVASHVVLPRRRHRFTWDPAQARELLNFGKWIFFGSLVYFVAVQSDRLMLGYYLTMTQFGVYTVALVLSEAVYAIIFRIHRDIMFPLYGKTYREEPDKLRLILLRTRLGIDVLLVMPIAILLVGADSVVVLLYDARYRDAGWILQILCVRLLLMSTLLNGETCIVAAGKPQYALALNIGRAAWVLAGIPIGWHFSGMRGVVWVVALSELPVLVVVWFGLARQGLFSILGEARSLLFVGLGLLLGTGLLSVLQRMREV